MPILDTLLPLGGSYSTDLVVSVEDISDGGAGLFLELVFYML
jgi:hypothetical protein